MIELKQIRKKRRWDKPFGRQPIGGEDLQKVLALPLFRSINPGSFPDDLPLAGIIANEARIVAYDKDQIVFQKGDGGSSIFLILCGSVRSNDVSLGDTFGDRLSRSARDGEAIQLSSRPKHALSAMANVGELISHVARSAFPDKLTDGVSALVPLDALARENHADDNMSKCLNTIIYPGEIFGISSALNRSPRNHSVTAQVDRTVLLEIRLSGLRELRFWSDDFRQYTDALYRDRILNSLFKPSGIFAGITSSALGFIAQHSRFEKFGKFDWSHQYQKAFNGQPKSADIIEREPVIAEQGHYQNDIIILCSGFARVSEKLGCGERTLGYLESGQIFGLSEFYASLSGTEDRILQTSLRAIGHTDIVRIPTPVFESYLWPILRLRKDLRALSGGMGRDACDRSSSGTACPTPPHQKLSQNLLDFIIDNRLINGTSAMAINTDRCVDCDECVRACAATHSGVPRFVRQGKIRQNLMIAQACMHCVDPVCLIDCPTGAIKRETKTGNIIIDDDICIGCGTCVSACPYDNIRMDNVKDTDGTFLSDRDGVPILQAIKCDHCVDTKTGPACQRACPTGALERVDLKEFDQITDLVEGT